MRYLLSLFLTVSLAGISLPAVAQMECAVIATTPAALQQELYDKLPSLGLGELPPNLIPGLVTPETGRWLMRGPSVVGFLRFTADPVQDRQELVVVAANGKELAHSLATYENGVRSIRFWSARDPLMSDGAAPLSITANGGDVLYEYQGKETPFVIWHNRYADARAWLFQALATTTDVKALGVSLSPLQSFQLSLAGRPEIMPYFADLTMQIVGGGKLLLGGALPSTALVSLVILDAVRAGFIVSNQLVVDSRIAVIDDAPRLYQCPRF